MFHSSTQATVSWANRVCVSERSSCCNLFYAIRVYCRKIKIIKINENDAYNDICKRHTTQRLMHHRTGFFDNTKNERQNICDLELKFVGRKRSIRHIIQPLRLRLSFFFKSRLNTSNRAKALKHGHMDTQSAHEQSDYFLVINEKNREIVQCDKHISYKRWIIISFSEWLEFAYASFRLFHYWFNDIAPQLYSFC